MAQNLNVKKKNNGETSVNKLYVPQKGAIQKNTTPPAKNMPSALRKCKNKVMAFKMQS